MTLVGWETDPAFTLQSLPLNSCCRVCKQNGCIHNCHLSSLTTYVLFLMNSQAQNNLLFLVTEHLVLAKLQVCTHNTDVGTVKELVVIRQQLRL